MAKTSRGTRDGTGPFKGSYQRSKTGSKGKRQAEGQPCPKGGK